MDCMPLTRMLGPFRLVLRRSCLTGKFSKHVLPWAARVAAAAITIREVTIDATAAVVVVANLRAAVRMVICAVGI